MDNEIKLFSTRLIIQPIHSKDAKDIFSYRSDAVANKYQGWIPKSINDVTDFIENRVAKKFNIPETWFQLVIIEKESKDLIGDIGIHFIDEQQVEVGCTLNKTIQGKGFATEALKAVIKHLFVNLNKHRTIASIDPLNTSSIKLVKRLGFRKEAHFKQSLFINGEWVDDIVYAVLRDEWLNR